MQDLSALTPPLLVGAVVIIAIVAFLRHEMGKSRAKRPGQTDENLAGGEHLPERPDSEPAQNTSAPHTAVEDSGPHP
jgi:hypothetical protein